MLLDVKFGIYARDAISRNNVYQVFAATSRILGQTHLPPDIGVFPIGGQLFLDKIIPQPYSSLRFRCSPERISYLDPLVGQSIEIDGQSIQIGAVSVNTVTPAETMIAWSVYFKNQEEPDGFERRAQYDLDRRGINAKAVVPKYIHTTINHIHEKRLIEVKGKILVAYSVMVSGLTETDSLRLIEEGMGGKSHFGCGLFIPVRSKKCQ